jgi:hypothetical protein
VGDRQATGEDFAGWIGDDGLSEVDADGLDGPMTISSSRFRRSKIEAVSASAELEVLL